MRRGARPRGRLAGVFLALGIALAALAAPAAAATVSPMFGSAVVDGKSNWEGSTLVAAPLIDGDTGSPVADLYLRYDCRAKALFAYVRPKPETGASIDASDPATSSITVAGTTVDGSAVPPSFAWIGRIGSTARGWEASGGPISPGTYEIAVATQLTGSGAAELAPDTDLVVIPACPAAQAPVLSNAPRPTYRRTYYWDVAKSGSVAARTDVDHAELAYRVSVTRTAAIEDQFAVGGRLAVRNDNPWDVPVTVRVEIPGVAGATCTVSNAVGELIQEWATKWFDYSCSLPAKIDGSVVASVDWDYQGTLQTTSGSAPYAFGEPTATLNPTVDVADAFAGGPARLLGDGKGVAGSRVFTYRRSVRVPQSGCTTYDNVATITSPHGLSRSDRASVQVCAGTLVQTLGAAASQIGSPLRLAKRGPARVTAGRVATYRITVRNVGRSALQSVTVTDVLPRGYAPARTTRGATVGSGRLTWRIGTLARGARRTVVVSVRVGASSTGRRCNLALAAARGVAVVRDTACTRVAAVRPAGNR